MEFKNGKKEIDFGTYLDRRVFYIQLEDRNEIILETRISKSVVCLVTPKSMGDDEYLTAVKLIFKRDPLALLVYDDTSKGKRLEIVLDVLGKTNHSPYVMTNICDRHDFLDQFFLTTYPIDERWKEWKNYILFDYLSDFAVEEEVARYLKNDSV